jgi:hypothetical protein
MRMLYNPKYTGDKAQIWKSFLLGSLVACALIYLVLTESVIAFFAALVLIIIGFVLFLDINIHMRRMVFLSQNIFFFIVGGFVTLAFYVIGFLLLYLGIVVILVAVTWLHRFRVKIKAKIKKSS